MKRLTKTTDLWKNIKQIQWTLNLENHVFAGYLELTEERFRRLHRQRLAPSVHAIGCLSERLGIDIEAILRGNIDYPALAAQAAGELDYIPEKYFIAARGCRRTSTNILGYIEHHHGRAAKLAVLRRFQIHESAFSSPDRPINIDFLKDLCELVHGFGYTDEEIKQMGAFSATVNKGSALGALLVRTRDVRELHEIIFANLISRYFDRNFTYQLAKLSSTSCVVKAKPAGEVADGLGRSTIGSARTCLAREGGFSSLPEYCDLPHSHVVETRCIHRGDPYCQYSIDFSAARAYAAFKDLGAPRISG